MIAEELFDEAQVEAAVIKAEDILADIPEPPEEELRAHFDQFRSVPAGSGEHGFGYLQPAAIQLSWIAIEPLKLPANRVHRAGMVLLLGHRFRHVLYSSLMGVSTNAP